MIYLDHAATSWPKPATVRRAVAEALAAGPEAWPSQFDRDSARVASSFGLDDPSLLLLTPSCTGALSIAVSDLPWEAGDRVLISAMEHHALHRPVRSLEGRGVEVVVAPRSAGGPIDLDFVEETLRSGGVRLVACSHACNTTGELLPVSDLLALTHDAGGLLLLDAAQTAGRLPIDLPELGVDMLTFAGHKGPRAPWGIGGLYIAEGVEMRSLGAACALPLPGEPVPDRCAPRPAWCDVGSVNRAALAGLAAGLEEACGALQPTEWRRAAEGAEAFARGTAELPGTRLHGRSAAGVSLPTVALTVDGVQVSRIGASLRERGVFVSAGVQCAPLAHEALGTAPEGVIRVSFGPQDGVEAAEAAVGALREVVRPR